MELQIQLKNLGDKIEQMKNQLGTEEATKTAFVLPFINMLGYDIFNPLEVIPEFTADLGLKKGEKVDYAIFQNGEPILIIECKHWKEKLDVHDSQLLRYFHVTKTRFALLTNGIEYRFYTDLDAPNKMDEKPFLEFNVCQLKDATVNEISKFHKANFDVNKIISNASALKYMKEIKKVLTREFDSPSQELVRLLASQVHNGILTKKVMEQFTELSQKALSQFISDKVSDRLTAALDQETAQQKEEQPQVEEPKSDIITTEEELEGYRIVVAILCRKVAKSRLVHRDTKTYLGILLDDNNRKPICRLHLNGGKKFITLFDTNKAEVKEQIESVEDIYRFQDQLLATVEMYG